MQINALPRKTTNWASFRKEASNAIALDGYVEGKPRRNNLTRHANFNHHEGVDRLATRCSAAQVFMAIKQGLMTCFNPAEITIWVNDCDQDVCTAIWLLQNWERVVNTRSEPLISKLVYNVDVQDTCAGAYPVEPESNIVRTMCWIFAPYTSARISGHLQAFTAAETITVIESVCSRISEYTLGEGKTLDPDIKYTVLGNGNNWKLVQEFGNEARTAMRRDGIQTFIAFRGTNAAQQNTFSLGNLTPFGGLDLNQAYQALNLAEGIEKEDPDRWGGSDSCGGSPRNKGSKLLPAEIGKILDAMQI